MARRMAIASGDLLPEKDVLPRRVSGRSGWTKEDVRNEKGRIRREP